MNATEPSPKAPKVENDHAAEQEAERAENALEVVREDYDGGPERNEDDPSGKPDNESPT